MGAHPLRTIGPMVAEPRLTAAPAVAGVPLQGGYVAKRCPVRAQNDHDAALADVEPVAPTPAELDRMDGGNVFERTIFDYLRASLGDGCVEVTGASPEELQDATVAALRRGVDVVLGGWLPPDGDGRRTGKPDIVVRVPSRSGPGYVPVDVKHHKVVQPGNDAVAVSPVSRPFLWGAGLSEGVEWRPARRLEDGLQLAHYWRMLEASGFAPDRSPVGGIVGSDSCLWWLDLGAPVLAWPGTGEAVSLLEYYDRSFAERLDVIARTLARNLNPALPRAVEPWWHDECGSCPWREVCRTELEGADDVSLVNRMSGSDLDRHRRRGVTTRLALANLHWPTADLARRLRTTSVPLAAVFELADGHPAGETLAEVLGRRRTAVLRTLAGAGVTTVGDLAALDRRTAEHAADVGSLCDQIDRARVLRSGRPHRARGVDRLVVPRADVEVDVDMESAGGGAYLWGTLTTVRAGGVALAGGYRPFATFRPLTDEDAARVFAEFWAWMAGVRRRCQAAGASFRAYCYARSAEEGQMRNALAAAAPGLPPAGEVEAFLASDAWVDMLAVVRSQVVAGASHGLKTVSRCAGFAYRDEAPSGEESMVWYRRAVSTDPEDDPSAYRDRLLRYNEDDVRATRAVRDWLDTAGSLLPALEDWEPAAGVSRP